MGVFLGIERATKYAQGVFYRSLVTNTMPKAKYFYLISKFSNDAISTTALACCTPAVFESSSSTNCGAPGGAGSGTAV